jgi:3-oxoacyl-ACP reductase-like protein
MGKGKASSSKARRAAAAPAQRPATRGRPSATPAPAASNQAPDDQIAYSTLSLHNLFEQQARQMLDRTDLDEEQKQNILVAMSCPCCGAGALSFTAKLKR